jgi:hypothetical protein
MTTDEAASPAFRVTSQSRFGPLGVGVDP